MGFFTKLLGILLLGYVGVVAFNFYQLWVPPVCPAEANPRQCLHPMFEQDERFDAHIFVSRSKDCPRTPKDMKTKGTHVLSLHNLSQDGDTQTEMSLQLPAETLAGNGNAYVHTVVVPAKTNINTLARFATDRTMIASSRLTRRMLHADRNKTLLVSGDETSNADVPSDEPVPHIRNSVTVNFVADSNSYLANMLPRRMEIVRPNYYRPLAYVDDFTLLRKDWEPLDSTSKENVTVSFSFRPVSIGLYRTLWQFEEAINQLLIHGFTEKDLDSVKSMFVGTSLHFLAMMYSVLFLHIAFDYLAFKNDISFWKSRKDLVGLSRRTVVLQFISNAIIFLHLYDADETSKLILIVSGISLCIDAWKVTKVAALSLRWLGPVPYPWLEMAKGDTKTDHTEEFDGKAMFYLSMALYPIVIAMSVYSLLYHPQKSWWSWFIASLAKGVYMFGFILMTPQLFINYKLKSVAHMPWRVLMYKAFNTFIDDVFSFIISMPTSHRLACLRDDVVFFVYLYQRWLYPVDMTRVNEFGMVPEQDKQATHDESNTEECGTEASQVTEQEDKKTK